MLEKTERTDILVVAAEALGPLRGAVVFVGGPIVQRLFTRAVRPSPRPIAGDDSVIEVVSRVEGEAFDASLRSHGFVEDRREDFVRRWRQDYVVMDVLPICEGNPGMLNPWYRLSVPYARAVKLTPQIFVDMIDAPHYLAAKLQTIRDWGTGDIRTSRNVRDIVLLLAGREEIRKELAEAPPELRAFVGSNLRSLSQVRPFEDACRNHLERAGMPDRMADVVAKQLEAILSLAE